MRPPPTCCSDCSPIIDDFERALPGGAADEGRTPIAQGVELIHRQLLELLRKRGVTPIEAIGADFDPHVHQAVAHEASPDHREGEVIGEMRRGYRSATAAPTGDGEGGERS